MASARNSVNNGHFHVKYFPHLKKTLGTNQAALTADRLEYWFSTNGGSFYKFLEPCLKASGYRPGNSLAEELGVSGKTVQRSFDLIGIRYKSKKEFDEALASGDLFKGKLYASYNNRQTYKTHYFRNDELADKVFGQLSPRNSTTAKPAAYSGSKPQSIIEHNSDSYLSCDGQNVRYRNGQNVRHRDGQNVRHLSRAQALKQINTNKENLPLNKQSRAKPALTLSQDDAIKVGRMIKIFNEIVGGVCVEKVTQNIKLEALESLKANFNDSLEDWEKHCVSISCSSFLMGETKTDRFKKIIFKWAFSPEFIERLRNGHYQRDREAALKKKIENLGTEEANQSAAKRQETSKRALDRFRQMSSERAEEVKNAFEAYLMHPDGARHGFAKNMLICKGKGVWEEILEPNWQSPEKTMFLSSFKDFLVDYLGKDMTGLDLCSSASATESSEISEIEKYKMELARISSYSRKELSEQVNQKQTTLLRGSTVASVEEKGKEDDSILIDDKTNRSRDENLLTISIAEEEAFASMREKAKSLLAKTDDDDLLSLKVEYEEYAIEKDPIALDILEKGGWDDPVLNLLFEQYLISHHCNGYEGSRIIH